MTTRGKNRWLALYVLCLGDLMIVLDMTVVNVALPTIRDELGFSQASLAWVVNAYLLTFGGFLLLGGRLGDLFGPRRLFLIGLAVFTTASLACGIATSQGMLVGARAVQGLGGAVVSAVALSLTMRLFTEPADRAKAMGIFGFVLSGGGTAGVLLGGVLTDILSWNWIFLVNLPVGAAVFLLSLRLLPLDERADGERRLDVGGAILVTAALMVAVYAIVNGNETGWTSVQTLGLLGLAAALFAGFLALESKLSAPLVPLGVFRSRDLSTANVVAGLMSGGMLAQFFFSALYMQQILGYSPLEVGLAYAPSTILWGAASLWLSDRLVMRFGIRPPLVVGMASMAVGLLLFARAPVDGSFVVDILPATLLIGLGGGIAFNPLLLAAMSGVQPSESGLASGLVNTSFMMGGALGLAVLAALASSRTDGATDLEALNSGYHAAFLVGGLFVVLGIVLAGLLLKARPAPGAEQAHDGMPAEALAASDQAP
jgi:EmrB/QacA subfamily drug resistance transporter